MPGSAIRRLLGSKTVPLVWCILAPFFLGICGLGIIAWWFTSNPVSELGSTSVPDQGTLHLGQNSHVEFGYNLWVKRGDSEWEPIGWSLNGGEDTIATRSDCGRFHGIVAEGYFNNAPHDLDDAPIVVLMDSQTGIIWPTRRAREETTSFWMKAWQKIKEAEPRFPKPPA